MGAADFRVRSGLTSASTTILSNVQQVSFFAGREHQLDQYNASTATVTLRYPTGYATPIASLVPGAFLSIQVYNSTTSWGIWSGKVANVSIDYGMPYSGGVGNADYVTIQGEGGFAAFARASGNNYAMAAAIFNTQATRCNEQTLLQLDTLSGFGSDYLFPASTIAGTWGDWINQCVLTMNGRIREYSDSVSVINAYSSLVPTWGSFSDVPADWISGYSPYEQIAFQGVADNYYTQVTVDPADYAAQTVQTGSAPYRTYVVNTLNSSTGQALDMANYLLATYQTPQVAIASVTVNMQSCVSNNLPGYGNTYIGTAVEVKFRGTTYNCIIEGVRWAGVPGDINATFYVSAQAYNNYLILDNLVYGQLDFNRLGY